VFSTYTFEMVLTGTHIEYNVFAGAGIGGTPLLTVTRPDSASDFVITQAVSNCGGSAGTTDYEEVYGVTGSEPFPQWDFTFYDTYGGSYPIDLWNNINLAAVGFTLPSSPWGYYEAYLNSGQSLQIANEPFEIRFPIDIVPIAPGGSYTASGSVADVGSYCSWGYTPCTLTESCSLPSGWSGGYTWGTYVPTTIGFTMSPPGSASPGYYYPGCSESISAGPNAYSNFVFYVLVT
jgi:hypothetical protein